MNPRNIDAIVGTEARTTASQNPGGRRSAMIEGRGCVRHDAEIGPQLVCRECAEPSSEVREITGESLPSAGRRLFANRASVARSASYRLQP
jgi:hypothetical protein